MKSGVNIVINLIFCKVGSYFVRIKSVSQRMHMTQSGFGIPAFKENVAL